MKRFTFLLLGLMVMTNAQCGVSQLFGGCCKTPTQI